MSTFVTRIILLESCSTKGSFHKFQTTFSKKNQCSCLSNIVYIKNPPYLENVNHMTRLTFVHSNKGKMN